MRAALAVLDRSQDPGNYENFVQPNTYRKMQSALTNLHQASCTGSGDAVGAYSNNKVWISEAPTHTLWFSQFMQGIKKRTGETVKQDKAISIEVLQEVLRMCEEDWEKAGNLDEKLEVARMGCWFSGGFCTALRGEEMLIVELAGTANSLKHLERGRHKDPYFCYRVTGRTKDNRSAGASFPIPCAGKTGGTKLNPGRWVRRLVRCEQMKGRKRGYLFSKKNGAKARLSDFEEEFYGLLLRVQDARPDLIDPTVDVTEEFGIWRSLRRGVTAHALNQGIPEPLVNMINRWRTEKDKQAGSRKMLHVYTELEQLIPHLLRYSLAL